MKKNKDYDHPGSGDNKLLNFTWNYKIVSSLRKMENIVTQAYQNTSVESIIL